MKCFLRGIVLILFTAIFCSFVNAQDFNGKMPYIKFNKAKYSLYYSTKDKELGGYINEYYKKSQTYSTWDEMVGLYHYANTYSPIDKVKEFSVFLAESGIPSTVDECDDNSAVIDFFVANDNHYPIVLEYNVFKFYKSPICGTLGFQYVKRYRLKDGLEVDKVKKKLVKSRNKYVKKVKNAEAPQLVQEEIDKGKIVANEGTDNSLYNEFK